MPFKFKSSVMLCVTAARTEYKIQQVGSHSSNTTWLCDYSLLELWVQMFMGAIAKIYAAPQHKVIIMYLQQLIWSILMTKWLLQKNQRPSNFVGCWTQRKRYRCNLSSLNPRWHTVHMRWWEQGMKAYKAASTSITGYLLVLVGSETGGRDYLLLPFKII